MTRHVPVGAPFSSRHFASSIPAKVLRALGAGPTYYFLALPRYLAQRRRMGLQFDARSVLNPLREFWPQRHHQYALPPAYTEALEQLAAAKVEITMPRLRFEALAGIWWAVRGLPGAVIECGAFEGATGLALATLGRLMGIERRVYLLDTFAGMPETGRHDPLRRRGEFHTSGAQVEAIYRQAELLGVRDQIDVRAGLFADTFRDLAAKPELRFSLAHVDANVYQGTKESCEFCLPRVTRGGAIVFDDYSGPFDLGARLAIDEYFQACARKPAPLAWSSAHYFVDE